MDYSFMVDVANIYVSSTDISGKHREMSARHRYTFVQLKYAEQHNNVKYFR